MGRDSRDDRACGRRGRTARAAARNRPRSRGGRLCIEPLEPRDLLAAAPFGAMPDDTAEFLLGDVLVTLVLMESKEASPLSVNTEDWTAESIAAVKDKVIEAMQWWEDTLDQQFPGHRHTLDFHFDFSYADTPVLTDYEPISHTSNWFTFWVGDFLQHVGFNQTSDVSSNIRGFNHAQRIQHGTDWAFTIFVANDENDADKQFAVGGQFRQAFSFPGGEFIVSPASRPVQTFAHETGHMFWARDEYLGGGSYEDQRGYYNARNENAWDNPTPGFTQAVSLMANGTLVTQAFQRNTSSVSSLEMIGWRDADGDGVMDVMDVPHRLQGTGYFDATSSRYRFLGSAAVQPLFNRNSAGLQNDITLARITAVEYRVDEGFWQSVPLAAGAVVDLDLSLAVPPAGLHVIEIRAVDQATGVVSNVFRADTSQPASVTSAGINGFVWLDANGNGHFEPEERGLPGWTVQIVDDAGLPLVLQHVFDVDQYAAGTVLTAVDAAVTLDVVSGRDPNITSDGVATAVPSGDAASGLTFGWQGERRVEQPGGLVTTEPIPLGPDWLPQGPQLRIAFTDPVAAVRLDAIGTLGGSAVDLADYARLEIYDSSGQLLGRTTTGGLPPGARETMVLERATADIAYALAMGHAGDAVLLDGLRIGAETEAVSDALGAYSIRSLPGGAYRLRAVASDGQTASPFQPQVAFAEGETLAAVNFMGSGSAPSWQNPLQPEDVTGEGFVTALDALHIINWINDHPGDMELPAPPAVPPPYLDVDGNGFVTAQDVLFVVNWINAAVQEQAGGQPSGLAGGGRAEAEPGEGDAGADAAAAETLPAAWQPIHPFPRRESALAATPADAGRPRVAADPSWAAEHPWRAFAGDVDRLLQDDGGMFPPVFGDLLD